MEKPLQEPETKALCCGPGHMLLCFIITKATGMGFGTFLGETPWGADGALLPLPCLYALCHCGHTCMQA